ncbi:MAG: TonB-dependent receptor, partial [Calditrichaeota bacterium]|nr:TonB-dependent receptor [Calditrichota bacterium]
RTDIRYKDVSGWNEPHLQNRYTANGTLGKTWSRVGLSTGLSASLYGPQKIPEGRGRSASPTYALWDWRLSKSLGPLELAASVQNLTNWTQADNPYSYDPITGRRVLDSGLYYGPLLGRTFHLSLAYSWGGKPTGEYEQ